MLWQRTLRSSTKLCNTLLSKPRYAVAIAATNSERRLLQNCNYYSTCTVTQSNVGDVQKLGLHRWSTWKQVGDQYLNYHLRSGHREDILYLHQQVARSTAALHFSHNDETATGTIISPDGYIVTSAHAFGDPEKMPQFGVKVKATFYGESNAMSQKAEIIHIDYRYDVAILKVDTNRFFDVPKFRSLQNPEQCSGSLPRLTYFGRAKHNDGVGMIVAKKCDVLSPSRWHEVSQLEETIHKKELLLLQPELEREIDDGERKYIWRDYGGPLVDADGNVVGILNTAASGYEYAIPSDLIFQMLRQSQVFGRIIGPSIGVIYDEYDGTGVLIKQVVNGAPADKAGVKQGEIIKMVNDELVRCPNEIGEVFYNCKSDINCDPVTLTLMDPETHATRNVKVNLEDPAVTQRRCYDDYLNAVTIEDATSDDDDAQSDSDKNSSSQSDNDRDDDNDDDDTTGLDDQKTEETIKEQPNEHEEEEMEENLIKTKVRSQPDHIGLDLQKMAKDVEMIHEKVLEMAKKIEDHSTALNDHVAQFHNYSDLGVPLRALEDTISEQCHNIKKLEENVKEIADRIITRDADIAKVTEWMDKAASIVNDHTAKLDNLGEDFTKVVEICQCHEERLKNKADLSYVDNLKWEVTRVK